MESLLLKPICETFRGEEVKSFWSKEQNVSRVINIGAKQFPPLAMYHVLDIGEKLRYRLCGPIFGLIKEFSIYEKVG